MAARNFITKHGRRAVTIPLYFLLTALVLAILPLTLFFAVVWDLGSLVNRTILVKLWKVPFDKIPKTREGRIAWLYENWSRIDQWIEKHKNAHTRPGAALPEPNFHP